MMSPWNRNRFSRAARAVVGVDLLGWAGVLLLPVAVAAGDFQPAWRFQDQPHRFVFTSQGGVGACALVTIPSRRGAEVSAKTAFVACDADGNELRHAVLYADSSRAELLVSIGSDTGIVECAVYYGATGGSGDRPVSKMRDFMPVSLEVFKYSVNDVPRDWTKMFYLFSKCGAREQAANFSDLGTMELLEAPQAGKPSNDRKMIRVKSSILCPSDGAYRFAVTCRDAGFALIDGELAGSWPGEHDLSQGKAGPPRLLKAGPHRMEVYNLSSKPFTVNVAWIPPGGADLAPIPPENLLTSREALATRTESFARGLQPDFTATIMPAYSFRDLPCVFVPVRLVNVTRGGTGSLKCRWRFSSGGEEEGNSLTHVFPAVGLHKVTLEVRDEAGLVEVDEKMVDCRQVQPKSYAVAFEVIDLPAVCFPADVVSPQLRLTGSLPPAETVEAAWQIRDRSGDTKSFSKVVLLGDQAIRLPLTKADVKSLSSLEWHVRHRGVDLGSGTIKFQVPPFEELPARVEGDRLYGGKGNQLVLVPHVRSGLFKQKALSEGRPFGEWLCVDDFLLAGRSPDGDDGAAFGERLARIVDGKERPVVRFAALEPWETSPGAYGPLLKLVQAPGALQKGTDVVILSVGLRDMGELKNVAVFERHAAALSDILAGNLKRPVIWVTPPPYPGHVAGARAFAAAIRRMADARGMPVVDLYTTFSGMRDEMRLFLGEQDTALSSAGRDVAAQMIVRTLVQE